MTLRAPFPWFGGKSRAAELVWSRLGDVSNYVEPFAGSLAILLARPHPSRTETVNDRDCYLANFWRAVKSAPERVAHYADWPVNEADLHARHSWLCHREKFRERMLAEPHYFDSKVAGWWVWGVSQWIGSGWCSKPEWTGRGMGGRAPRGINTLDARRPNAHPMGIVRDLRLSGGQYKRPVINNGGRGVTRIVERPSSGDAQRPHLSSSGSGVTSSREQWGLGGWLGALAARLRRVRVICGDWTRVVTPSCTWKVGGGTLTGVVLDPPYSHGLRDRLLYSIDTDIAAAVRRWALSNGENPLMRIALCGLRGEHDMPAGWEQVQWHAPRGYSNKPRREVIWFSPHCLRGWQRELFEGVG